MQKKLTVIIPTIKRKWTNLNIYTMYVIIHLESLSRISHSQQKW